MNVSSDTESTVMVEWFENSYECSECNEVWTDEWSCMCNDRCPECDSETQPSDSVDLSRCISKEDYLGASRLMRELHGSESFIATEEDARDYAEALLEGGEYRFAIRRGQEALLNPLPYVLLTAIDGSAEAKDNQ